MKSIILDFDQTLADTSILESLRTRRKWESVYANISLIRIYPGISDFISKAKSLGYKIGVVTNSPKKYCILGLSTLEIAVDTVIGYHDTIRRKPFPDPIFAALHNLNAVPKYSIALGDSLNDIKAYNSAGVKSVACLWGCSSKLDFAIAKPDHIIGTPANLLELFES